MCSFYPITGVGWLPSLGGLIHYSDVIMSQVASSITSLTIVYSTVYTGTYQRKHQNSASLACARGTHRWPVNSPHKGTVMRKMFPFDYVIIPSCNHSALIINILKQPSPPYMDQSCTLIWIFHFLMYDQNLGCNYVTIKWKCFRVAPVPRLPYGS